MLVDFEKRCRGSELKRGEKKFLNIKLRREVRIYKSHWGGRKKGRKKKNSEKKKKKIIASF